MVIWKFCKDVKDRLNNVWEFRIKWLRYGRIINIINFLKDWYFYFFLVGKYLFYLIKGELG